MTGWSEEMVESVLKIHKTVIRNTAHMECEGKVVFVITGTEGCLPWSHIDDIPGKHSSLELRTLVLTSTLT
jgi:hypothetical protein